MEALLAGGCYDKDANEAFIKHLLTGTMGHVKISTIINTPERLAAFIAQLSYESSGLTDLEENSNYRPERALQVFGKRISGLEHAKLLCAEPRLLFNQVYNGRMGNRKGTDDGWNYRGMGLIMTTGSNNYKALQEYTGVNFHEKPERLLKFENAFYAAIYYFKTRRGEGKNLFQLADNNRFRLISRLVNGGRHGISKRLKLTQKVLGTFTNNTSPSIHKLSSKSSRGDIKEAQYILKELGYYKYRVDGFWGPGTSLACQTFAYDNRFHICNLFNLHEEFMFVLEDK